MIYKKITKNIPLKQNEMSTIPISAELKEKVREISKKSGIPMVHIVGDLVSFALPHIDWKE